jgi:predicted DNA-binding protein YlxM (UPF0122 family)
MILVFLKNFNIEDPYPAFFKQMIESLEHINEQGICPNCPKCKTNKHFVLHSIYDRHMCIVRGSEIIQKIIPILRLRCNGCTDTHAILPDDVIPYSPYGKSFVMYCLKLYYLENKSVSHIAELTNTYEKLIYRFLKRYSDEMISLIVFIRTQLNLWIEKSSHEKALQILSSLKNFREFLMRYYLVSNRIYLMSKRQNLVTRKTLIGYQICKYMGFT